MKREVFDCNNCGAEDVGEESLFTLTVGSQPDPAGGRSETIEAHAHLCSICRGRFFCHLAGLLPKTAALGLAKKYNFSKFGILLRDGDRG